MNEKELSDIYADWEEELSQHRTGISDELKEKITQYAKLGRKQTEKQKEVPYPILVKLIEEKFDYKVNERTLKMWVYNYE